MTHGCEVRLQSYGALKLHFFSGTSCIHRVSENIYHFISTIKSTHADQISYFLIVKFGNELRRKLE